MQKTTSVVFVQDRTTRVFQFSWSLLLPENLVKTAAMLQASEVGSRTLSRFEVEDEQIYLVISDRSWTLAQKDKTLP